MWPDSIHTHLLEKCAEAVCLTHFGQFLINLSMRAGCLPFGNCLMLYTRKCLKVIPWTINQSVSHIFAARGLSVLFLPILSYLESEGVLCDVPFGFWRHCSTENQLFCNISQRFYLTLLGYGGHHIKCFFQSIWCGVPVGFSPSWSAWASLIRWFYRLLTPILEGRWKLNVEVLSVALWLSPLGFLRGLCWVD